MGPGIAFRGAQLYGAGGLEAIFQAPIESRADPGIAFRGRNFMGSGSGAVLRPQVGPGRSPGEVPGGKDLGSSWILQILT